MASGGLHHQYKASGNPYPANLNLRQSCVGKFRNPEVGGQHKGISGNRLIHYVSFTKMIIKCIAQMFSVGRRCFLSNPPPTTLQPYSESFLRMWVFHGMGLGTAFISYFGQNQSLTGKYRSNTLRSTHNNVHLLDPLCEQILILNSSILCPSPVRATLNIWIFYRRNDVHSWPSGSAFSSRPEG